MTPRWGIESSNPFESLEFSELLDQEYKEFDGAENLTPLKCS